MKGLGKLIWRFVKLTLIAFFAISVLGVIAYRFINPPVTWLMITRGFERKADGKDWKIDKEWRDLDEMSPNMPLAAAAAEDATFLNNYGFDFKAIERAAKNNQKGANVVGGSTITQQTAKNVFLWSGRSWIRKGFEAYFTLLIQIFWSKQRIMEVYLNVIEMGDGIYGVQAAAQAYYQKDAKDLTRSQCAAIASILPSPLHWSANKPSRYVRHRQSLIKQNMRQLRKLEF
jgi:monofunctional biosynthetic peptidoglycan transglycosylase